MPRVRVTAAPARAVSEAQFTRQVVQYARLMGWLVHHQRPGLTRRGRWCSAVQGDVGLPDLICLRGRRLVVMELKVGRNKPTRAQLAWVEGFRLAGVPAFVFRPEHWPKIEEVLSCPKS